MDVDNQFSFCATVPPCSIQTSVTDSSGGVFSDNNCGEPLISQRIVLDFTPDNDVDQENRRKCIAFWEFVNTNPDLQMLGVGPDYSACKKTPTPSKSYAVKKPAMDQDKRKKTAVSVLELIENKGLIDPAFGGKLPQSYCSLGVKQYSTNDSIAITQGPEDKQTEQYQSRGTLRKLCLKLNDWDSAHPRCTKPPDNIHKPRTCKSLKNVS